MVLSRVALNARLGDGRLSNGSKNANISFYSTDKLLLKHKEKLLIDEGYSGIKWGTQESGYGGTKTIYKLTTFVSEKATIVRDLPIEDILNNINERDLILWYLDDGSWHKKRNTMHLYSNMLNEKQTQILINRIHSLYGVKPTARIDKKQDGRSFYYLYFPRDLVLIFRPIVQQYLIDNGLSTLYYKVGGINFKDKPNYYLSDNAVRDIRLLFAKGIGIKEIAVKSDLKERRVRDIVSKRTYKDVI